MTFPFHLYTTRITLSYHLISSFITGEVPTYHIIAAHPYKQKKCYEWFRTLVLAFSQFIF